jgi:rare lipoprotein A
MQFGFIEARLRMTALWRVLPMVALGAMVLLPQAAEAKTPGKTYCFNRVCHRVKTLQETAALIGKDQKFKTSFYDDCKHDRYNPCGLTSSGEVFRPGDADNAASPIFPNGTVLLVRNPANGESAVVRVNNAGPYWGSRKLDVSRGTAEKLGFKRRGVANLEVRIVYAPTKDEARYKKNRHYDPVPGPIGQYASLALAGGATLVAMNGFAPPASQFIQLASAENPQPAKVWRVAAADQLPSLVNTSADDSGPAEALKAEARRESGKETEVKRAAPATLTAEIAPIHRARQQYTVY